MIQFTIIDILIASLMIFGMYEVTSEGRLLYKLTQLYWLIDDYIAYPLYRMKLSFLGRASNMFFQELSEPLFGCVICMSSLYGITYFAISGYNILSFDMIVFMLALAGFNKIVSGVLDTLNTLGWQHS